MEGQEPFQDPLNPKTPSIQRVPTLGGVSTGEKKWYRLWASWSLRVSKEYSEDN